jgi:hypothetical protein
MFQWEIDLMKDYWIPCNKMAGMFAKGKTKDDVIYCMERCEVYCIYRENYKQITRS